MSLSTSLIHLTWVIPLLLLVAFLLSPRFRGTVVEDRARRLLMNSLPRNQFTVLSGVTIASGGGTRRIPLLVVSQFGLFVIEPVYRPGRITGTRVQDFWTQRRLGRSRRFDNPNHRADLNVQALERRLNLPGLWCHSLVVLSDNSRFTGAWPRGVVPVSKLVSLIRNRRQKLLEPESCAKILSTLMDERLERGRAGVPDAWTLLAWSLAFLVLVGLWLAFREPLTLVSDQIRRQWSERTNPERYHPDGREKSEQELWESSLVCAYSVDTGRCSCYEPSGQLAALDAKKCQDLAEKGSILKQ